MKSENYIPNNIEKAIETTFKFKTPIFKIQLSKFLQLFKKKKNDKIKKRRID